VEPGPVPLTNGKRRGGPGEGLVIKMGMGPGGPIIIYGGGAGLTNNRGLTKDRGVGGG